MHESTLQIDFSRLRDKNFSAIQELFGAMETYFFAVKDETRKVAR